MCADTGPNIAMIRTIFFCFVLNSITQAMGKYAGGTAEYRSSEGKAVEVPYRGPVEGTLLSILGGLRSACTYVGRGEFAVLNYPVSSVSTKSPLSSTSRGF